MSSRHTRGFSLIELMVVVAIIVLVTGMTIPLVAQFMRSQKLPRAARVIKAAIRNAQVLATAYFMETQLEVVPGTDNQLRVWGRSGICKYPLVDDTDRDWDRAKDGYLLISEARRLNKNGGLIRILPLNKYSFQSQILAEFGNQSSNHWEFAELRYSHFSLQSVERAGGVYDIALALEGLEHPNGMERAANDRIFSPHAVAIQSQMGAVKKLPRGVGIDVVSYVTYADGNLDGMPDGNPLALSHSKKGLFVNPVEPFSLCGPETAVPTEKLFSEHESLKDRKPRRISGSLSFTREGTLNKQISLRYFSLDPVAGKQLYFRGAGPVKIIEPTEEEKKEGKEIIYDNGLKGVLHGFLIFDKTEPDRRMFIECTGLGLPRNGFGVYAPKDTLWGSNFNYQHPRGLVEP